MQGVWKTGSYHCNIGQFDSSNRNASGDFLYRMEDFAFFLYLSFLATFSDEQLLAPIVQGKKLNQKIEINIY